MTLAIQGIPTGATRSQVTREQYEVLAISLAPRLKRAAIRLAFPDMALAEDLVQNALVRGYQMILEGRFEAGDSSLSWFIRGITTDYLAHLRKHRRCEVLPPGSGVFLDRSAVDTPESLLIGETISEQLAIAMDQLPPDQRDCIELVDLSQCSYVEAARILRVPVGTVRSRLSRARLFVAGRLITSKE
jgi:RNA polymerase sigma-70 factor (ECF subfamily)